MARNRFTNPADATFYDWEINHSEEESFGRKVSIEHSAPTGGGTDFVRQESQQDPLTMRFTGTILSHEQYAAMWFWYTLSRSQSIYFTDVSGAVFEVTITLFDPKRRRVVNNPRGGTAARLWVWDYTIEMEVINVISGWP